MEKERLESVSFIPDRWVRLELGVWPFSDFVLPDTNVQDQVDPL